LSTKTTKSFIRTTICVCVASLAMPFFIQPVSAMGSMKAKVTEITQGKNQVDTPIVEETASEVESTENSTQVATPPVYYAPPGTDPYITPVDLSEEEVEEVRRFHKLIKLRQYSKSYVVLKAIPEGGLSKKERAMKKELKIFEDVETIAKENEAMFKQDDSIEPEVKKTVKRLYRGAQESILDDKDKLAKDLLVQSLFLDRRNIRSKKLLELGLDLPLGSYKVENVESKYWKQSLISFRSGFPGKAIEDLKVLEYFDPENPEVFERMGSFHYTMGETKEAVDSWKRALYLNPENRDLEKFIKNAETEIIRQDKVSKDRARKKKDTKKVVVNNENFQLLRVVTNANVAYSYAQEVRTQMPGRKVVVEETDDGKYAVKIEKPKGNKN
jgi:tetratricopeptide (TPR) repeat protein